MLKSPAATLASGIPHILMTNGLSYIPEIQRPALGNIPAQHRPPIDKVYFKDHIDAIVAEHRHAAELGAAEEWRKGLFKKGKDAMADASRWEKWEAQIRPGSDVAMTLKEYDPSSFPDRLAEAKRKSAASQHQQPAALTNGKLGEVALRLSSIIHNPLSAATLLEDLATSHVYPRPRDAKPTEVILTHPPGTSPSHAPPFTPYLPQPGQHTQATPAIQQMAYPGIPAPPASQGWPPQQVSRPNHILQDPEERRQARKEEIERRCLQLDPPLDPSALPYMESFRNAMQIVQPMTDQAWATLEPLLLAQREAAELQAHHKAEQLAALRATLPSHGDDIYRNLKPAKELYDKDKEYDDVQEPLRRKLVEYVEEYVNTAWNGNPVLDSSTTPVFAANAILHVYKRYTEEDAAGLTPKPDLVAINARRRQDNQLESPFLSLDNMKWLFENKIRAYLDPTCSSIFLCAECLEESPKLEKWFAFEGLIQHFGAKHTTSFSRGNVTVYWQVAEWPAEPPFFPKPEDYIRPLLAILRKAAGFKGRGNAKNTPQPRRDAPYKAPVTIKSESFYNSNGHHGGAHGYSSSSYDQSNHHGANRGGWQSETQSPRFKVEQPDALDEVKADRFAADVREVWDALEGVSAKDMLNCIRVHTVFHHTNDRILSEFGVVPTLDIVTDAFAINAAMQPIKTAGGLACKQCVANQTDGSAGYQSYYSRIKSVKLYNLGGLINHFKIQHLPQMPYVIWMRDMMELPEAQLIKDLARVQGMDMEKFKLIAAAFPDALPDPVGALMADSTGISSDGRAISGAGVASKFMEGLTKKKPAQPQSRKKIKREGSDTPAARAGSQEGGFPEPLEHEYDPRKPMASREQDGEDDDARFDTDVARRKASAAKAAAAAATPNYFGLAPETLRAIQTLGIQQAPAVAGYGHGGSAGEVKMDRAPSVGRDDYAAAPAPAAPPPSTASNSNVQPNIAAILASLTNGGNAPPPLPSPQVTTPVEQNRGSRHSSISRSGHRSDGGVEQLYRSLSTSYPNQGQDRPSTSGYPAYTAPPPPPSTYYQPQQVQYRPSIEPPTPSPRYEMPPGHDLQAALQRNARHFSQNAAPPPQPSALAYAAAPSPQQAHIAPPRYAYPPQQYDDGYGQGYYASVPQPQPQQRTVYVDEHGREVQLIPVEQYGRYAQGPQGQEFFYGTGR